MRGRGLTQRKILFREKVRKPQTILESKESLLGLQDTWWVQKYVIAHCASNAHHSVPNSIKRPRGQAKQIQSFEPWHVLLVFCKYMDWWRCIHRRYSVSWAFVIDWNHGSQCSPTPTGSLLQCHNSFSLCFQICSRFASKVMLPLIFEFFYLKREYIIVFCWMERWEYEAHLFTQKLNFKDL